MRAFVRGDSALPGSHIVNELRSTLGPALDSWKVVPGGARDHLFQISPTYFEGFLSVEAATDLSSKVESNVGICKSLAIAYQYEWSDFGEWVYLAKPPLAVGKALTSRMASIFHQKDSCQTCGTKTWELKGKLPVESVGKVPFIHPATLLAVPQAIADASFRNQPVAESDAHASYCLLRPATGIELCASEQFEALNLCPMCKKFSAFVPRTTRHGGQGASSEKSRIVVLNDPVEITVQSEKVGTAITVTSEQAFGYLSAHHGNPLAMRALFVKRDALAQVEKFDPSASLWEYARPARSVGNV